MISLPFRATQFTASPYIWSQVSLARSPLLSGSDTWPCPHPWKDDSMFTVNRYEQIPNLQLQLQKRSHFKYLCYLSTYVDTAILIWNCTGIAFVRELFLLEFVLSLREAEQNNKNKDNNNTWIDKCRWFVFWSHIRLLPLFFFCTFVQPQLSKRCRSSRIDAGCEKRPEMLPSKTTKQGEQEKKLHIKEIASVVKFAHS